MGTTDRPRAAAAARLAACAALLLVTFSTTAPAQQADSITVTAQVRPHLFGTVALPGPSGRWGDKWQKVASDARPCAALQSLVAPARALGRLAQLQFVQAQVDRRIGWRSDGTQYNARIYWASAAETLASGFGDDDDRAILKYQALRALGYPRSDYYLMMGRDQVRGDYVMLAARADGRWWLLEEQGDLPVAADRRAGFEPVASFGAGRSWIHGRPRLASAGALTASGAAPVAARP
ncbi:hypothetical protein GCM10022280_01530 [Sphingomonas swuensis]|uniref:Uncharacterized protein n=1 Tax=Sphingomonas swuensis TaxID=977800 RepID=A0ABP7S978_9SPHN